MRNAENSAPPLVVTLHEIAACLRSPLTSLLAATDLLADTRAKDERAGHLATIRAQAHALAASLAELEGLERLQRRELDLTPDTFDLRAVLQACVAKAATAAAERSIEVRTDFAADLPKWVQGQPTHVRKLASRLLSLAVQHSTIGSCDFTASMANDALHLVVQNQSGTTAEDVLAASHTGPADSCQTIGLAFCGQLATALGGNLAITQRPRGGLLLHLTLPMPAAAPWEAEIAEEDAGRTALPTNDTTAVRGRVLLVDDSRDHQRLIGHLLTRAGADVTTADNGAIALHLLGSSAFDLVLMDMHMPELDGFAATQELRRRGITTPVLALTVDSGAETTAKCLASGCNGHMEKPVRRDSLLRTLGMYLPQGDAG
jgi:CheY-like chemotaxis protein